MEFILVPLLAIAAVAYGIYKLAEQLFHIHLTCRLLLLLVSFAWLISLVLPGFFFHSAGFLGSVGISLVSALGFAWLAATYDDRTQASRPISAAASSEPSPELQSEWPCKADAMNPPIVIREERPTVVESVVSQALAAEPQIVRVTELPGNPPEAPVQLSDTTPQTMAEALPQSFACFLAHELEEIDIRPTEEIVIEELAQPESVPELSRMATTEEPMIQEPMMEEPMMDITLPGIIAAEVAEPIKAAEESTIVEIEESEQPLSDSLEDLLEFAFSQRSRNHLSSALETFRLVKHLYSDSDALPMVTAEIVSTLQSLGDLDGAAAELTEILELPEIRKQAHLVRIFEQQLAELRANDDFKAGWPG